jgi:hypothetical protein
LRGLWVGSLASGAIVAATSTASASPILALTTGNALVSFDSAAPSTTLSVALSGTGGEQILGIDFRPMTGQLYGIGSLSNLYTIDPLTGLATLVGALGTPLSGTAFGVDFNPTVDRLRVTSDADQSLRINPGSPTGVGTIVDTPLAYAAGDVNAGVNPSVAASAYTNSFSGASSTTLYGIDIALNTLVIQNPANAGTLTTVGGLGFDATSLIGFDISGSSGIAYAAWATAGAATSPFYTINLGTGSASFVGLIATPAGQQVRGLAVVPEVTQTAVPEPGLMGVAGLALLIAFRYGQSARRRR